MKYKIYALQKESEIYYVGITKQSLKLRRKTGWKFTGHNDFLKSCYMFVLEETNDKARETFYIQVYRELGHPLLNKVIGDKTKDRKSYHRNYYAENKDKCRDLMKNYQETHKEEQRKYRREYYRAYWKKKKQEKNENDKSK